MPSTPKNINNLAPRLTCRDGKSQVSLPTRSVFVLMFFTSAAILFRNAVDFVKMTVDSSRSSLSDRVERLEEPMKVAKGLGAAP